MMKLSTMEKVVNTVNTAGYSPLADELLHNWEHTPVSARLFRASANFIFTFNNKEDSFFLRFTEASERTQECLQAEVELLQWLASHKGITVAAPVLSHTGSYVETVETRYGTFRVVVFNALKGAQFEISDLNESQYTAWGATLGKLHQLLKTYPENKLVARPSWKDHLHLIKSFANDAPLQNELAQVTEWAKNLPVDNENFGLIHYDFELDNLCWDGTTIGMLDFDDCARYWFVADIAYALRDLFGETVDFNNRAFQAFVKGYSQYTELDRTLLAELPMFYRLHKLVTYARLTRALDMDDTLEHPQWLAGLEEKLKSQVDTYKMSLTA